MNNRGFGLRDEIIVVCIMLILLLYVAVQINKFYHNIEEDSKHNNTTIQSPQNEEVKEKKEDEVDILYYTGLENRIRNATLDYINENDVVLSDDIVVVYSDTLINNGYISTLYDQYGSSRCSSTSNVYKGETEEITVSVYLNCSNYNTKRD